MKPIFDGNDLEKKTKDGMDIYTFGEDTLSVDEDFMEANPQGAAVYMVFVATSEEVDLKYLRMDDVPFKYLAGSRGMKVDKKKKTEYVTATCMYHLKA